MHEKFTVLNENYSKNYDINVYPFLRLDPAFVNNTVEFSLLFKLDEKFVYVVVYFKTNIRVESGDYKTCSLNSRIVH